MMNMFRAEMYRLTKSAGFWVFWAISVVTYIITVIYKQPGGVSLGAPLVVGDDVKLDVSQVSFNFTFYFLLIAPVFSIIACEFSEHTVKNTISSGISKSRFFAAKSIFTMGYCLLSFLAANYLFYVTNHIVNGKEHSSSLGEFSKALISQLPLFAAIISVFIFVAFFFKKGAAFNAITIITPILVTTIYLVLWGIESTKSIAEKLLTYELSTMVNKLALGCTDSYRAKCYIISAVVTAVSLVAGYFSFTKTEAE